jgi:hypothetical protein
MVGVGMQGVGSLSVNSGRTERGTEVPVTGIAYSRNRSINVAFGVIHDGSVTEFLGYSAA